MILWLQFAGACLAVIIAGRKLVYHADKFAKSKGWGDVWIGFVLLALATTLPELFTSIGAVVLVKVPDLALGNIFGSIAFNLLIIAILDMIQGKGPLLRKVDTGLIMCGAVSITLSALVAVGISSGVSFTIAGIGPFSVLIALGWLGGTRLIFNFQKRSAPADLRAPKTTEATKAFLKYLVCAGFIFGASIWLVRTVDRIAEVTGWGHTFVGMLFLGMATSLPEATTTITAVRRGAFNMAMGNILGANIFNIAIVFICDCFLPSVNILSVVSVTHILTALLGILMTGMVIVGIIYRSEKSFFRLGWDSIGIAVVYIVGVYILFQLR